MAKKSQFTKKTASIDAKQSKDIRKLKKKVMLLESPVERKWHRTAPLQLQNKDTGNYTTFPFKVCLNNVPNAAYGATTSGASAMLQSREKKEISMTRLRIKGQLYNLDRTTDAATPTGSVTPNQFSNVRVLIIRWPKSLTAPNTFTPDAYLSGDPNTSQMRYVLAFYNREPGTNYDILHDKVYQLGSRYGETVKGIVAPDTVYDGTGRGSINQKVNVNIDLKFKKPIVARWPFNESVPGGAVENNICMYVVNDNANLSGTQTTSNVHFEYNTMLDFLDQ